MFCWGKIYKVLVDDLKMYPQMAGKLTGMMLQPDNNDLLQMLAAPEVMKEIVEEGVAVLTRKEESLVFNQEGNLQQSYYPGPPQFEPAPLNTEEHISPSEKERN